MKKFSKKTIYVFALIILILLGSFVVNAYYLNPKANDNVSFEYFHQLNLNVKDEATRSFLGLPPYKYNVENIKNLIKY